MPWMEAVLRGQHVLRAGEAEGAIRGRGRPGRDPLQGRTMAARTGRARATCSSGDGAKCCRTKRARRRAERRGRGPAREVGKPRPIADLASTLGSALDRVHGRRVLRQPRPRRLGRRRSSRRRQDARGPRVPGRGDQQRRRAHRHPPRARGHPARGPRHRRSTPTASTRSASCSRAGRPRPTGARRRARRSGFKRGVRSSCTCPGIRAFRSTSAPTSSRGRPSARGGSSR